MNYSCIPFTLSIFPSKILIQIVWTFMLSEGKIIVCGGVSVNTFSDLINAISKFGKWTKPSKPQSFRHQAVQSRYVDRSDGNVRLLCC